MLGTCLVDRIWYFPKLRIVIFVHGCFWHRHSGCSKASVPKTRREFWERKLEENASRDRRAIEKLQTRGWATEIVWECETKNPDVLSARLEEIFEGNAMSAALGAIGNRRCARENSDYRL